MDRLPRIIALIAILGLCLALSPAQLHWTGPGNPTDARSKTMFPGGVKQNIVGGAATTCQLGDDGSGGTTAQLVFGDTDNSYYIGQDSWSHASQVDVCRVDVWFGKSVGNVTGKSYVLKIWTMTGTALNANVYTSDNTYTADNTENQKLLTFTFTNALLDASTSYSFTLSPTGASDGTNYGKADDVTPSAITGSLSRWKTDKTRNNNFGTYDFRMKIYWLQ
jgi:hypothetical protein